MRPSPLSPFCGWTGASLAAAAALLAVRLPAAPMTPGSLLVYTIDVGTGNTLSSAAAPVVIREFATTGPTATNYQNFALPTTGGGAFTASGTAASDGQLLRSADGAIATFAGYNAAIPTTGVTNTILRLYASIDPAGVVRYSTPFTMAAATNVRGAVASSAAAGFYVFGTDGFAYAPLLATEIVCTTGQYSVRGATIFNGRIYGSTGSVVSNNGVNIISDGLPTVPAYYNQLPGFTDGVNETPNAIRLHDLNGDGMPDTLYVAIGNTTNGGVKRYNFNGTSWVLAYTLNTSPTVTAFYGLTSRIDPGDSSRLQFFATTQGASNGGNRLVSFTDSATFGNTTSPGPITLTQLRQAQSYQSFRGVDFSPAVAAPLVANPTATSITNTTATLGGTVTSDGSSAITARGVVYALTSNPNPQLGGPGVMNAVAAGTTTGIFTVNVGSLNPSTAYNYAAYATNAVGTRYSPVATFTTNRPPVAGNDTLATARNTPVSLPADRLLLNDSDPDGDALTVQGVDATSTAGGTVGLASGTLTYTPLNGFTGPDSFSYTISDGRGGSASGTVNVTVNAGAAPSQNFVSLTVGAGGAQILWRGIPGRTYTIQYSDDLGSNWQTFPGTVTANATGAIDYTDTSEPLPPQRFYRTVANL